MTFEPLLDCIQFSCDGSHETCHLWRMIFGMDISTSVTVFQELIKWEKWLKAPQCPWFGHDTA